MRHTIIKPLKYYVGKISDTACLLPEQSAMDIDTELRIKTLIMQQHNFPHAKIIDITRITSVKLDFTQLDRWTSKESIAVVETNIKKKIGFNRYERLDRCILRIPNYILRDLGLLKENNKVNYIRNGDQLVLEEF